MSNKLAKLINKINKCPDSLRRFLLTKAFCSKVKFANTSGILIDRLSANEAHLRMMNKKKVQNHIGGVHAVAAGLLAESATGILVGLNITDNALPLLKSMNIEYKQRMQGDLKAVARISPEQQHRFQSEEKGNLIVEVEITDDTGEQPIFCQMEWAWVPKRK